jgi:hypothetical protein
MGVAMFGLTLLKEITGEAALERETQLAATACDCPTPKARRNLYLTTLQHHYEKPNRCC